MSWKSRRVLLGSTTVLWGVGLVVGMWKLEGYEGAAGAEGRHPVAWPVGSGLERAGAGATLVMAVHPKCACSRASVAELARVMAHASAGAGTGGMRAYVLAVVPAGAEGDWGGTDLVHDAGEIPGVRVVVDRGGVEARRFGAATSGDTSLYGADGRLVFRGGITAGRGHEGDNGGEDAVLAAIAGEAPAVEKTPVFGCAIFNDGVAGTGAGAGVSESLPGNGGGR